MDAAEYHAIATQLGVCDVERDHVLANAHWDLQHRPDEVRGDDPYEIAAAALTAFHARPVRPQAGAKVARHHAWQPGHAVPDHWDETPADRWMTWFKRARANARKLGLP